MKLSSNVKSSLYTKIGIVILLSVLSIMVLRSIYSYYSIKERIIKDMHDSSKLSMSSLQKNIAPLIESFAIQEYNKLVLTEIQEHEPLAIVIENKMMADLIGEEHYLSGKFITKKGNIVNFDDTNKTQSKVLQEAIYVIKEDIISSFGDIIGTITVYSTAEKIQKNLQEIIKRNLINTLALSFILITTLFFFLRRLIVKPLLNMIEIINIRDQDGIPLHKIPNGNSSEISILTENINSMITAIKESKIVVERQHLELEKSHKINRTILETMPDLIWLKDLDGKYMMCNPNFERFFGAKEQEIVGKTDYDFVDKELADFFRENDLISLKKGEASVNEEWVTFAIGGEKVLLETTKVPIKDNNGNIIGVMGIGHDITQRDTFMQELDFERNRFKLAIEGSQDGLWDWDVVEDTIFFSEQWKHMLGYSELEISADIDEWFLRIHPDDIDKTMHSLKKYFHNAEGIFENRHRIQHKDGSWIWILARGKALFNEKKEPLRMVGFITNITEQINHQKELDHIAKYDTLTHLPNRFLFHELIKNALYHTDRHNNLLAIFFIDLDGFKEVNDTYGHSAGDAVLIAVAKRMKKIIRKEDIVSRLGGDEFIIAVSDLKNKREATLLLERLITDLQQTIYYKEDKNAYKLKVSASIGVSFYPQKNSIGSEVLLRQADQAMYEAKKLGKNRYHFFNHEDDNLMQMHYKKIKEFEHALQNDELILYFQPKINMSNGNVQGFEALIRWNHPERGVLGPNSFLPEVNSEKELMIALGRWVFNNAFHTLSHWIEEGYNFNLNLNISAHEFKDAETFNYIESLLQKYPNVEAKNIELEILETNALQNTHEAIGLIKKCQAKGFRVALDDFGTGYSTLSYLKELPVNTLKIDRAFIIDMLYDNSSLSIIEAALGLAQAFKCDVVAEGVETIEHGVALLQLGCNIAQGYVISKPLKSEDVIAWVNDYKTEERWLNTPVIHSKYRSILYAIVEHRSWIAGFEEYIKSPQEQNYPELDRNKCHLGQWLQQISEEMSEEQTITTLITLHHQLHDSATTLINAEELKRKEHLLQEMKEIHNKIIKLLNEFISTLNYTLL